MLHTHNSFNNRVVTLTKIGQKFISATSQGMTNQAQLSQRNHATRC